MSASDNKLQRGMIQVYTGEGKGKTTAALGIALRAAGHGLKTAVIQFIKGFATCGEHLFVSRYRTFDIIQLNKRDSFSQPKEELRSIVEQTMTYAHKAMLSGEYHIIVLDEILTALNMTLLNLSDVLSLIDKKPYSVELILTGRHSPPEIIERADLVTEMKMVKHPLTRGIKARKGIEY